MEARTDRRIGRAAVILTTSLLAMVALTAAVALWPRGDIEIPSAWYSQSDDTLVIFGRESCPACAASATFHRELAAAAEASGIRVVAAMTARGEDPAAFAASLGLAPDRGVFASPAPKRLTTVPTILVVNRLGRTLQKKEGALSIDDQRALLEYLKTLR